MHRIDQTRIDERKTGKDHIKATKARIDVIAALPSTTSTAQLRTAVKDLAVAMQQVIKLVT